MIKGSAIACALLTAALLLVACSTGADGGESEIITDRTEASELPAVTYAFGSRASTDISAPDDKAGPDENNSGELSGGTDGREAAPGTAEDDTERTVNSIDPAPTTAAAAKVPEAESGGSESRPPDSSASPKDETEDGGIISASSENGVELPFHRW